MEKEIILIGADFNTDITDIDIEALIQPKLWPTIEHIPSYSAIEPEIIAWLEKNVPETYRIAVESSKRKAHDKILINAIKAKVLFEQLDYIGLRSLQLGRFMGLTSHVFDNLQTRLTQIQKKHDVKPEFVEKERHQYNAYNIDAYQLYSRYGSDIAMEKVEELLEKQPDSAYLNLCKKLNLESKYLDVIRKSVDEIDFSPKDQSDHQTCACCFRWIRLQPSDRSRIAYHGFTRSDWGTDVVGQSCDGAKFPPFQVSAEGTIFRLNGVRNGMISAQKELDKLDQNSREREVIRAVNHFKGIIRSGEYYFKNALARIEKTHPDRLEEAQKI